MAEPDKKPLRQIARPFVADGPSGVSVRDRLKGLTTRDEKVLRLVGAHMGRLASRDLARRCRDGMDHSTDAWAERKRELTAESSSRWAGSVTSDTHDQPVEYVHSLYRGDRYRIVSRLALGPRAQSPAPGEGHHPGIPPGDFAGGGPVSFSTHGVVQQGL